MGSSFIVLTHKGRPWVTHLFTVLAHGAFMGHSWVYGAGPWGTRGSPMGSPVVTYAVASTTAASRTHDILVKRTWL